MAVQMNYWIKLYHKISANTISNKKTAQMGGLVFLTVFISTIQMPMILIRLRIHRLENVYPSQRLHLERLCE